MIAGMGVTAFGFGAIPSDPTPLPEAAGLPSLAEAEFALGITSNSKDPVVTALADLMRRAAPMIIARLEEQNAAFKPATSKIQDWKQDWEVSWTLPQRRPPAAVHLRPSS